MGDGELLERLKQGDEQAFRELVTAHHASLVRLAETFVPSRAVAEEVAQDAWLGIIRGLSRFEGRSSLKTWMFSILVNRARTTGSREPRASSLQMRSDDGEVFTSDGAWATAQEDWPDDIVERLSAPDLAERVRAAISMLPDSQRQVVTLRDMEGLESKEVCALLDISEGNQRVLLHRGRGRLRKQFEEEIKRRQA